MTLVDSNVLFDLLTDDPRWASWSSMQLDRLAVTGPLVINDVVYAELSVGFDAIEELDRVLSSMRIQRVPTPAYSLFLAGKAYRQYRAAAGARQSLLPDFFIGAHAASTRVPLLTRDPRRYRSYFPAVTLITP